MAPSAITSDTRVLIVDDSAQYATILQKLLGATLGVKNIQYVDRTEKAAEKLAATPNEFDLIFVDFRFPDGKNGVELLERLGATGILKDKVAFLITSEPSPENVKRAMAAGARGVVAKPFDRQQLAIQFDRLNRSLQSPEEE